MTSSDIGVCSMSPFWNHILGFIYVEIAKIVATWKLAKLAKKHCIQVLGIWTRDQYRASNRCGHSTTSLPPSAVAIKIIYQSRIGYIWIHTLCWMYEFRGHRVYEFILCNVWIHIWRCDVWGAAISLAAPHTSTSISLLPRPIRVPSAARTS
jgi:hypothetical protein